MTTDLLTPSRAYLALPGAPTVPAGCCSDEVANIGRYRAEDGTRWVFVPEAGYEDIGAGEWLPDLADAATGGVMLDLIRGDLPVLDVGKVYCLRRLGTKYDPANNGATLAESVARFAVALGRAA